MPGQVRSIIISVENLRFVRITYNYAGLEKYLMKDIFVAGIYEWVLRKLAFQSYYTGD
jgi:hypothetical protein